MCRVSLTPSRHNVVCAVPTHDEVFGVFLFSDLLSLKQLRVLIIPGI